MKLLYFGLIIGLLKFTGALIDMWATESVGIISGSISIYPYKKRESE